MNPATARPVRRPTDADLAAAREVVGAHLTPTPVVRLPLDGAGEVFAKLDTLQPTGSFKVRGAFAAVAAYGDQGAHIVTASAGNHGLGIAYAAARLGVPATVVVPATASEAKVDALRRLGADLVEHGDGYDAAEAHALALADGGATFVSAYNDPHVIAGQATWVAEVRAQVGLPATALVPVGGGGLVAGTALAAAGATGLRVVGVEAAASRAVSAAVTTGHLTPVPVEATLADGLAGNLEAGAITPWLAAELDVTFCAVDEDEIAAAIRHLATRCGLVVEGSGAVGVAGLRSGRVAVDGPAVVLLTGRNITPSVLARVLDAPG